MAGSIHRWLASAAAALLCLAGASTATAHPFPPPPPLHGAYPTLEGCRNNGDLKLPTNDGKFICPDTSYTTGNLGKGWNELDLVPHRLTLSTRYSRYSSVTTSVRVAVDNEEAGRLGYDVLSTLTLNAALSSPGCTAATVGAEQTMAPGVGGTDKTLYRTVTVTQPRDSICVYDFYARLALGSRMFPGSSLHANLANEDGSVGGVGARDVSIPVADIVPQSLRKDMSATADADVQWDIVKTASPASVAFGDVCSRHYDPTPQKVSVRVEWKKVGTTPSGVTFVTHVYARNPAARPVTVTVTDKVYKGSTAPTDATAPLDTAVSAATELPAGQEVLVLTHTKTLPASANPGNEGDFLNDVATATYTDKATNVAVAGSVTATANAKIGKGAETNSSAAIADIETLTGTGLKFSVASPTLGSFTNYTPGTATTGPVNWGVTGQNASGSVTFDKTVTLDGRRLTSGKLSDTATLVATPGGFTKYAALDVPIASSASVRLRVLKSIPHDYAAQLKAGEYYLFTFRITRSGDPTFKDEFSLKFLPGDTLEIFGREGLVPDTYTVTETSALFFAAGATAGSPVALVPWGGTQQTVRLTAGDDGVFDRNECSGAAYFRNVPAPKGVSAQVQKLTDPVLPTGDADSDWTFTLKGPGLPTDGVQATAKANGGFVKFNATLGEGTYTVTETPKANWLITKVEPDMNADKVCELVVDLPQDDGKMLSCTFSNQKKGKVQVIKTVRKWYPPSGSQAFTFQLRENASPTSAGSVLETGIANAANGGQLAFATWLTPGAHYQMCEVVPTGWSSDLSGFVPNAYLPGGVYPNPDVDNSVVCADFTVTGGETKQIKVDNRPARRVEPRTIGFWKNWASCSRHGGQAPVLDLTLARAEPTGLVVSAFGTTTSLVLHGSRTSPTQAPDCDEAVRLLNKSTIDTGMKVARNPAFNLAAQLVAARLNYLAGAPQPSSVTTAINQAVALLGKVHFNGITHDTLGRDDARAMRQLAQILDDYNNDRD